MNLNAFREEKNTCVWLDCCVLVCLLKVSCWGSTHDSTSHFKSRKAALIVSKSYLDSRFSQVKTNCQSFSYKDVWIVSFLKDFFHLFDLPWTVLHTASSCSRHANLRKVHSNLNIVCLCREKQALISAVTSLQGISLIMSLKESSLVCCAKRNPIIWGRRSKAIFQSRQLTNSVDEYHLSKLQ